MVSTLSFLSEILFYIVNAFVWLTHMYRLAQTKEWKFVPYIGIKTHSSLLSYTLEWRGPRRSIQLLMSTVKSLFISLWQKINFTLCILYCAIRLDVPFYKISIYFSSPILSYFSYFSLLPSASIWHSFLY